ncbi:MAG: sigma-70 family RNA polymerase sigma factor [Saprospiraceae bacterium]|nr:sigma-70 family RNA polymerase sigma factor [Saprospiraceae bacterium]
MENFNYIPAILSGDRVLLQRMYAGLFPAIRQMVNDHVGTEEDAKDIFQDAVIVIYEMAKKPGFQLTSKFSTLFYGIGRNLWMSRRQKRSNSEVTILDHAKYIPDESQNIDLLEVERGKLFYKTLRLLGEDCQKLLQLFFQKQSMDEIAQEMGFASEGYARRRKSQCKDRLVELIKKDAVFPELQTA